MISLDDRVNLAAQTLMMALKLDAPKDTWNLTYNGIALVQVSPQFYKIVIGGENAPYAIYTDKREGIRCYHWVENCCATNTANLTQILGGKLSKDDVLKYTEEIERSTKQVQKTYLDKLDEQLAKLDA